jgi:type VI secretion system protein ImpC
VVDSDSGLEARFTLERERGGVIEEPAFRILAIGDWSGHATKKRVADRQPIEIDRDDFDDVMARLETRLLLKQQGGSAIALEFRSLDDFHPDEIFKRLPMFTRLRDLRRDLLSSDSFDAAAREIRSWLKVEEPAKPDTATFASGDTSSTEPSDNLLDAILSGSTAAAPAPKAAGVSSEMADLVSGLVRPHLVSVDENEQAALLAAVDAATSELMQLILHDHEFQALEAAWRGLYLLTRRSETGTDLKIFLLDISKGELIEDLRSVGSLNDSIFYEHLVQEAIDTPGGEPWAVVVGNYAFAPIKEDVAALIRIAQISAAAGAPFISHIKPKMIGVSSAEEMSDPSQWNYNTEADAGKLWTVLRGIPEAEYLGMVVPRFLARLPYGSDTEPLESFQFEEFADAPEHHKYLWANGSFIAALLLAQSYTAHGWDEMKLRLIQDIEDLPLHVYKFNGETIYQTAGEILLTQSGCERLMEWGMMPLVSYKNTDHVKLARFQSISDPVTGLKGRWS